VRGGYKRTTRRASEAEQIETCYNLILWTSLHMYHHPAFITSRSARSTFTSNENISASYLLGLFAQRLYLLKDRLLIFDCYQPRVESAGLQKTFLLLALSMTFISVQGVRNRGAALSAIAIARVCSFI